MHPNPPQGGCLLILKAAAQLPPRVTEPPPARPHAASCFLCTFLFCKRHLSARLVFAGVIRQVLFGVTAFAALLGHVQQPCPAPSRMRPPLPSRSPPLTCPGAVPLHPRAGRMAPGGCGRGSRESRRCPACAAQPGLAPTAEVGVWGPELGPQSSPVLPSPPWRGTGSAEECEGRATPAKRRAREPQPPSRSEQRP